MAYAVSKILEEIKNVQSSDELYIMLASNGYSCDVCLETIRLLTKNKNVEKLLKNSKRRIYIE